MSCEFETELTAYVDEELPAEGMRTVAGHLRTCAACRSREAMLRRTVHTLAALPAFEPSGALRRSVLQRVETLPNSFSERFVQWLRPAVLLPSAAGLLAASALAFLLVPARTGPPGELQDGRALEVAMNYQLLRNYEVLGLDSPDDVEVVAQLDQLEGQK